MLWLISIALLVLWVFGMVSGAAIGGWIHILLIIAIIALIIGVIRRASYV